MRMLLFVTMPHEPFNTLVRTEQVGPILRHILDDLKPEVAYFTEEDGARGLMLAVEVADPSRVPALAEPFFLNFNADCRFRIAMTPADLEKAGLDALGQKWG
ncbi:MAG: panthothenate synthetase [Acidobacteriota bacterium]